MAAETRQQLRDEARKLGLPHTGNKEELRSRIAAAKTNGEAPPEQPPEGVELAGVVVRVRRLEDRGLVIDEVMPVGDVMPGEVPLVLEKAVAMARAHHGLPPIG